MTVDPRPESPLEGGKTRPVDDLPMPGIPRVGPQEWTPIVSQVGRGFHVSPTVGMMSCGNWGLNPYHRRGIGNFLAQCWRVFSGAYLRREYPKNERALRKAIAECEVWCERETAEQRAAAAVLATVQSGSTGVPTTLNNGGANSRLTS